MHWGGLFLKQKQKNNHHTSLASFWAMACNSFRSLFALTMFLILNTKTFLLLWIITFLEAHPPWGPFLWVTWVQDLCSPAGQQPSPQDLGMWSFSLHWTRIPEQCHQRSFLWSQALARRWRWRRRWAGSWKWWRRKDHTAPEQRRGKHLYLHQNFILLLHLKILSPRGLYKCVHTSSFGKPSPTRKLAVQLEKPETAIAAGRGPWEKSSATMNHGIGPGPISKLATKPNTATMAR